MIESLVSHWPKVGLLRELEPKQQGRLPTEAGAETVQVAAQLEQVAETVKGLAPPAVEMEMAEAVVEMAQREPAVREKQFVARLDLGR